MAYFSGSYVSIANSEYNPGVSAGGQDYVGKFYNSSADKDAINQIGTSRTYINYSGVGTQGFNIGTTTPSTFTVVDTFGGAAGANIVISGIPATTINGGTSVTLNTAYQAKTVILVSGVAGVAGSKWVIL